MCVDAQVSTMSLHLEIPTPLKDVPSSMLDRVTTPSDSEELHEFKQIFDDNMPSSGNPISHDNTAALLLSFDSEAKGSPNLDVKQEVQELEKVLGTDYNFEVENKVISSDEDAHDQALDYLSQFRRKYSKRSHALLIVYFAGHGWRSHDEERKRNKGFNLYGAKVEYRQEPSEGTFILWEVAEKILHDLKCDVLVVLDCCDTRYFSRGSHGRAFEYLGPGGQYTSLPGKESFTSALVWALRKLKTDAPFNTETLRDKIKKYRHLPTGQEPLLVPRFDYLPEPIWISRMRKDSEPRTRRRGSSMAEFREEGSNFVDCRLFFNRQLSADDGEILANMMKPLVQNRQYEFNARHVQVLKKGTCQVQTPKALSDNWRKFMNKVVAVQRFRKQSDDDGLHDAPRRKRPRPLEYAIEDAIEDPSQLLEAIDNAQRPTTPGSEGQGSNSESTPRLRIQYGMHSSPTTLVQQSASGREQVQNSDALLKKLEDLECEIHRQNQTEEMLSRIREAKSKIGK